MGKHKRSKDWHFYTVNEKLHKKVLCWKSQNPQNINFLDHDEDIKNTVDTF